MVDGQSPFDGGRFHYVKLGPGPENEPDSRPESEQQQPDLPHEPEPAPKSPAMQSASETADAAEPSTGRARSVPPPWQAAAEAGATASAPSAKKGRALDRVVGVLLGLVLGVGIVTAFVFLGSEETIDAPRVQDDAERRGAEGR